MDCETAMALISALVDREIRPNERVLLELHLEDCAACRVTEDAFRFQNRQLRRAFAARRQAAAEVADRVRSRLPIPAPPAVQAAGERVPPCSLLVVDDEPAVLDSLSKSLRLLEPEFDVVTAESADAAQALLARRPFDIILTDQRMPRRTGVELLAWVRQHQPRTVRLLMTAYTELADAVEAINRGQVYYYLLKPWRLEELLQILRNAAEKFNLERSRDQLLVELRRLNRSLETRVAERTRELEEANLVLQKRTRELERLALTDPLTGLFNRRAMDELARFELKRHARYPSPLTLGIIDVDHFKRINTDYLHTGGDEVLKGLARLLSKSLRAVDSVGRIGGEEFLVIAPETNEEGASHLAERIRRTVESTPIEYQKHAITITVSVGLAVADVGTPADHEQMHELAAGALSRAKLLGRNRAVIQRVPAPGRT
jgi:diguanylate cyclase (GGDEF)-like protein